jgi:hypothetical protein
MLRGTFTLGESRSSHRKQPGQKSEPIGVRRQDMADELTDMHHNRSVAYRSLCPVTGVQQNLQRCLTNNSGNWSRETAHDAQGCYSGQQ